MGLGVSEMVADPMMVVVAIVTMVPIVVPVVVMMMMMVNIKIVQDEKPREEESGAPEWVRDPGIKIIVIPGWRVVTNDRRTLLVVIIVNGLRRKVLTACWRLTLGVLARSWYNS